MRYLFGRWDEIERKLKEKHTFLFLDFDGTLVPIATAPDKAILSKETEEVLKKISENSKHKLAIISGRALKDIKNMVGLRKIIYVGNHGFEIEGPKIKFTRRVSSEYKATLAKIKERLSEKLSKVRGFFIEDKGQTLSVHYRLVSKDNIPFVEVVFHETVILHRVKDRIKIKPGKMVFEISPPVEWDKGKVALWLLARQKFILKNKGIFPVYIGDDVTDEDAFKVLRNKGLTVFVGKPKISYAAYYLKDTKEVIKFLKILSNLNGQNN